MMRCVLGSETMKSLKEPTGETNLTNRGKSVSMKTNQTDTQGALLIRKNEMLVNCNKHWDAFRLYHDSIGKTKVYHLKAT